MTNDVHRLKTGLLDLGPYDLGPICRWSWRRSHSGERRTNPFYEQNNASLDRPLDFSRFALRGRDDPGGHSADCADHGTNFESRATEHVFQSRARTERRRQGKGPVARGDAGYRSGRELARDPAGFEHINCELEGHFDTRPKRAGAHHRRLRTREGQDEEGDFRLRPGMELSVPDADRLSPRPADQLLIPVLSRPFSSRR